MNEKKRGRSMFPDLVAVDTDVGVALISSPSTENSPLAVEKNEIGVTEII